MKKLVLLPLLLISMACFAQEKTADEWENTTISDATIKKIQEAKYIHKQCIATEMQKESYQKQDRKTATEAIVKQCEPVLGKIREVYLAEKVPAVIADRHLKQIRIQTTRSVLQNMIFNEAAKAAAGK